jgi:hypothetical protein
MDQFFCLRRRGIVDNNRIPEREAKVKASYADVIKPASEHCMKGLNIIPPNTT